jgi:hypothetical protein
MKIIACCHHPSSSAPHHLALTLISPPIPLFTCLHYVCMDIPPFIPHSGIRLLLPCCNSHDSPCPAYPLARCVCTCTGTLKLLYEDIISTLRAEGRRELAFGFAPFFNVCDNVFPRIAHWIRWTNLYLYHCGNNLYAFQNLAFSKIR